MSDSESDGGSGTEKYKNTNYKSPSKKKRQKKGEGGRSKKDYCFDIALLESNNDKFTEVSFLDLVAKEEAKARRQEIISKTSNGTNGATGLDPYASDDDTAMKALAAKYEEKYAEPAKKKAKKRKLEYDDIGEGYDESDPFIDNSECFDEVVPQEVTTAHGGFYINTGSLEFKANDKAVYELSSDDEGEDDVVAKRKNPKKETKKKVQFKEGKEMKTKKAKVINTVVKRKARIINTDKNKRGPKVINTESNKVELNGKKVEVANEKSVEENNSKPPEIIDLEAQLTALSNASDISKSESSNIKNPKNINLNIPKPTPIVTKLKSTPKIPAIPTNMCKTTTPSKIISTPTQKNTTPTQKNATPSQKNNTPSQKNYTPSQKNNTPTQKNITSTLPGSEVKITLTPAKAVPPPTAPTKSLVKPSIPATVGSKVGWQNQVSFPASMGVTITNITKSNSTKLIGGATITSMSTESDLVSKPEKDQPGKTIPAETPSLTQAVDLSSNSWVQSSQNGSESSKVSNASPSFSRQNSTTITQTANIKPTLSVKPADVLYSPSKIVNSVSKNINKTNSIGNDFKPSPIVSSKITKNSANKNSLVNNIDSNSIVGSTGRENTNNLSTQANYYKQKTSEKTGGAEISDSNLPKTATGTTKTSTVQGYYTSPVKSKETTQFTTNKATSSGSSNIKVQKTESSVGGSDLSQQIGRVQAAALYQQMAASATILTPPRDMSPSSTSNNVPDQSMKISSSNSKGAKQLPATRLPNTPNPPQPSQRKSSLSLTPDETNSLLRNAESLLNNLQQQHQGGSSQQSQQQAAYIAQYQQHLSSQKKPSGYDISNLLSAQASSNTASALNQQSPNRSSPNTTRNPSPSSNLLQQQQQQQQSYFYNNFAYQ